MIIEIWDEFLYRTLFNGLIWIYNNWTDMNMGWAIVYLTVLLRFALLPFTLVTERAHARNAKLSKELKRIQKEFHNDPILRKEEMRRVLKQRKVSPWSKAVVLGIQGLVLVLLYQVFVQGTTGERMIQTLYASIQFPGTINNMFYGFDISLPYDIIWSGIVMIFLMVEIYIGYRTQKGNLTRADLAYFILFPAAVFVFLYILPMVKALFILTSLIFSAIVHQFSRLIFRPKEEPKSA